MTPTLLRTVKCFVDHEGEISSVTSDLKSPGVLLAIADDLRGLGYEVGGSRTRTKTVLVPVYADKSNEVIAQLRTCARHAGEGIVLYVEAGRAVTNFEFLHDIIEASMMSGVRHACVAVRRSYGSSADYDKAREYLELLFASGGVKLSLDSVLLIGY